MPAAMLCEIPICQSSRETACIVNADETMRIPLEGVLHRYHEDPISAQGIHSLNHYNLVHKFIPMPQLFKIPNANAAVEKEW